MKEVVLLGVLVFAVYTAGFVRARFTIALGVMLLLIAAIV